MASTWSNLKIQLMTTGENSTTWGTVTNANLGTALEEAIAGSADVTFASNNQTLTLTNTTATQTARNMRLNLTGTTGGSTRTLTVPDIEKVYIVNNGCADAVQVKNSTGANVSVPAGKSMWLFSTGTAVVDVVTHLSSLTLGSALPVTSGGTGSTTAAFSGENITSLNASNVSTGTLANARTTASSSNGASTIVARDASGNFSANVITADGSAITSLNAGNISSGTLAVARGGTGITSVGTAGNVLTSNGSVWTSSAPATPFSWNVTYVNTSVSSGSAYSLPSNCIGIFVWCTIPGSGNNGGIGRAQVRDGSNNVLGTLYVNGTNVGGGADGGSGMTDGAGSFLPMSSSANNVYFDVVNNAVSGTFTIQAYITKA